MPCSLSRGLGSRRSNKVKLIVAGLLVAISTIACAEDRPNIVYIALEDITPMMGCYGDKYVALPHLLPEHVARATGENGELRDGKGTWVATTDFLAPHVKKHVQHVIPEGDVIRYRFGDQTVVFEPVGEDMNRLKATVLKAE